MAKDPSTKNLRGLKPKPKKAAVTYCEYLGNACTCTNLNGPGCKKKQQQGCYKTATN